MKFNENQRSFSPIRKYLLRSLKFYELKDEKLAAVVFVSVLLVGFVNVMIPLYNEKSIFENILRSFAGMLLINIISSIYLFAYIRDLRQEKYTPQDCTGFVLKNIFKIVFAFIAFIFIVMLGFAALLIPSIIFSIMFIFYDCSIMDKNMGIIASFKHSMTLTAGRKLAVFTILISFFLVLLLPFAVIGAVANSSINPMMSNFIMSFASAIMSLMELRLTALLYNDLEYGLKAENDE